MFQGSINAWGYQGKRRTGTELALINRRDKKENLPNIPFRTAADDTQYNAKSLPD